MIAAEAPGEDGTLAPHTDTALHLYFCQIFNKLVRFLTATPG